MPQLDDIVGKSQIQAVLDLDKALNTLSATHLKLVTDVKGTAAAINTNTDNYSKLKIAQEQTVAQTQKLSEAEKQAEKIAKDQAAATAALEKQRQAAYATMAKQEAKEKELSAAIAMEVKSINDAEKQNKALLEAKKKLNITTEEGKKKNEQYNQAINKNTEFIRKNSDAATQQRMNIGNYSQSIQDALGKMGPFGAVIQGATSKMSSFASTLKAAKPATDTASTGISGVGKAFIASGIGAIIVAIVFAATMLYKIFSSFSPLVKVVQQAMAGLTAIFDVLKNTVVAIVTGTKNLKEAFSGLGGRMKEAAQEAANLKKSMQDLEGAQLRAEVSTAKLQTQINELILQSKNRTLSETERIALIDEALTLEQKQFKIEKDNADEQLRIAQDAIAIKAELTDAEKERLKTEGIAFAQSLKKKVAGIGDEITALKDALINEETVNQKSIALREKAENRKDVLLEKAAEKNTKIAEDKKVEQQKALDKELEFLHAVYLANNKTDEEIYQDWLKTQEQKKKYLDDFQNQLEKYRDEEESDDFDRDQAKREKDKEKADKEIEEFKTLQEQKIAIAQASAQALQEIGNMLFEQASANIQAELDKNAQAKEYELQMAGDNKVKIAAINEKYAEKEKQLKIKAAKQSKAQALFNAIIGTAMATVNGFMSVPFLPVGLAMGILAGVLGTLQIGLIAAQPIPQFFKGTENAPDGLISVAEQGQELIKTRSGKTLLARNRTLLSGMKGATIYSNQDTEAILKAGRGGYDSKELRETLERNNDKLIKTIKDKKEFHLTTPPGTRITSRQGAYFTNYWTRKLG